MLARFWQRGASLPAILAVGLIAMPGWSAARGALVAAGPINPKVYKDKFDAAKKDAAVVAQVRVLAVVCTEVKGEGKARTADLLVTLQVLDSEKGPVKKNEVIVVPHKVNLPAGPGPGMYGFWASVRQCPSTAGVKGHVALNWDKDARRYVVLAGWVPDPNLMPTAIPSEAGKAFTAGDSTPAKGGDGQK
jgi:hypothetical protein